MTYIMPSPYKCIKCGHEFIYSPHAPHDAPSIQQDVRTDHGTWTRSNPVCPKCWSTFLRDHVGIGYSVERWRPEGSDYELAMKENDESR